MMIKQIVCPSASIRKHIEWTAPVPCAYGLHQGQLTIGSVDGEPRFTVQYMDGRVAKLLDGGEFVTLTAGEEMGETHVEHLQEVAQKILEWAEG